MLLAWAWNDSCCRLRAVVLEPGLRGIGQQPLPAAAVDVHFEIIAGDGGAPVGEPVQYTVKSGELVKVGSGVMLTPGSTDWMVVCAVALPAGVLLP